MSQRLHKTAFPVSKARKYLEPGPVLLLSSQFDTHSDIMTLGWHTVLEFSPSLVGCMISSMNHSHALIRDSGQCVLNVPSADLIDKVVAIGNSHGDKLDKFDAFGLTAEPASVVNALSASSMTIRWWITTTCLFSRSLKPTSPTSRNFHRRCTTPAKVALPSWATGCWIAAVSLNLRC